MTIFKAKFIIFKKLNDNLSIVLIFLEVKIEDLDTEEKNIEDEGQDICGSQDYSQDVWEENSSNDSSDEVKL